MAVNVPKGLAVTTSPKTTTFKIPVFDAAIETNQDTYKHTLTLSVPNATKV